MGGVAWTEEEDQLLMKCIEQYGEGKWHRVPLLAGLKRCRKSCRLRWLNYLRPNIRRESFMSDEIEIIIKLHQCFGNKWSLIASKLSGRTANDVKNYWHCHLSKIFNKRDNVDKTIEINNSVTNIRRRESSGSKQTNQLSDSNTHTLEVANEDSEQQYHIKTSKDSNNGGGGGGGGEIQAHKVCIQGNYDQNMVNILGNMEYDLDVFGNETTSVMDESFYGLGKWDLDELPIDLGLWSDSI